MSREVMQQALDAWDDEQGMERLCKAMDAIRAELAKLEPEPVAWRRIDRNGVLWLYSPNEDHHEDAEPLYRKESVL